MVIHLTILVLSPYQDGLTVTDVAITPPKQSSSLSESFSSIDHTTWMFIAGRKFAMILQCTFCFKTNCGINRAHCEQKLISQFPNTQPFRIISLITAILNKEFVLAIYKTFKPLYIMDWEGVIWCLKTFPCLHTGG